MGNSIMALIIISIMQGASCEDIWCPQAGSKDGSICNCSRVPHKPWPKTSETPAPKPNKMTLEWSVYTSNMETQIGVNVTWSQKGADFNCCVEGYYLEISEHNGDSEKYLCEVWHVKTSESYVTLHFVNWQPVAKRVRELTYEITPLPLYTRGHKPSVIYETLIIPECCEDEVLEGTVDTNSEHTHGFFPVVTTPSGHVADSIKLITIISLVILLTFIIAMLVYIALKRRKEHHSDKASVRTQRILIITDDHGETSSKVANEFSVILRKYGGEQLFISTNATKSVEIGETGVVEWIAKSIVDVDVVMVVVDPDREDHEESNLLLPSNVALKCLGAGSDKMIVVSIRAGVDSHVVGASTYNLRKDFRKIVERVLGKHMRSVVQDDVLKIERHLQSARDFTDSPAGTCNDLNHSLSYQEQPLQIQSWNITEDELPSRESNL